MAVVDERFKNLRRRAGLFDPPGLTPPRLPSPADMIPQVAPSLGVLQPSPGPNQVAGAPHGDDGFGSIVGRLLAGADDPRLTPEQNEQARRQALIQGGLATMLAASQPGASALGSFAQGALMGRQTGATLREHLMELDEVKMLAERIGGGPLTLEGLYDLFGLAMARGDVEMARTIQGVIQSREAREGRGMGRGLQQVNTGSETLLVDSLTGEVVQRFPRGEDEDPRRLQAPREVVIDGRRVLAAWDPEAGEFVPVEGASPVPGRSRRGGGTEGQRKARAFLDFIPDHVEFIDSLEEAPGRVESALSARGLRELTDAEQQRLRLAGSALAEAWLRMTTGAAYNEREFRNAFEMFVPQPGDREETLEAKRANRARLLRMLQNLEGGESPPNEADGDVLSRYLP